MSQEFFRRDDVMILFTTSLAGLGHVRVTEALRSGLASDIRSELLGIDSRSIQFLHRIASRNSLLRKFTLFMQDTPGLEDLYTYIYLKYTRRDTAHVFYRLEELVKRRRPKPEVLIVVSTHFGLAHRIAEIKNKLSTSLKMCVILCVIVTDDSPQKIWGVAGADYIFVPTKFTKKKLTEYMESKKLQVPKFVVSPYPVSLKFTPELSQKEFENHKLQVKAGSKEKIRMIIPISGAAVQLKYFEEIIIYLDRKDSADTVVVARESEYTNSFLRWCEDRPSVAVVADTLDRDVVISYENELAKGKASVEITKPSEQTFKALLTPKQKGGVLLLFSDPVGRQENDNLNFLATNGLIPNHDDREILNRLYRYGEYKLIDAEFLSRAGKWRGVLLPLKGEMAGRAILRLKKSGVFQAMMNFDGFPKSKELRGNGAEIFWRKLGKLARMQCSFLPNASK